ncbi:hypothetical protein BDB00DRAFT_871251 [Zychaea mexicana]|uniref:uncharacterized protein n=1 Tax=Zychaea mexicana TaxID=64656 RepID=UPI0022FE3F59|nr:uncharacterized protein BDB00DRAFT_871251 [Zychaea mexicana]KAI9494705.1 hypothetical protein BDB00DRAFT_871251 [Zychaea mexicana]
MATKEASTEALKAIATLTIPRKGLYIPGTPFPTVGFEQLTNTDLIGRHANIGVRFVTSLVRLAGETGMYDQHMYQQLPNQAKIIIPALIPYASVDDPKYIRNRSKPFYSFRFKLYYALYPQAYVSYLSKYVPDLHTLRIGTPNSAMLEY